MSMYEYDGEAVDAPRERSAVEQSSENLAASLADLDGLLVRLEKRLTPVLRPLDVQGEKASAERELVTLQAVREDRSPHAMTLRKHLDMSTRVRNRVESLLGRLDV